MRVSPMVLTAWTSNEQLGNRVINWQKMIISRCHCTDRQMEQDFLCKTYSDWIAGIPDRPQFLPSRAEISIIDHVYCPQWSAA
jgi:hypothetical protein